MSLAIYYKGNRAFLKVVGVTNAAGEDVHEANVSLTSFRKRGQRPNVPDFVYPAALSLVPGTNDYQIELPATLSVKVGAWYDVEVQIVDPIYPTDKSTFHRTIFVRNRYAA